VDTDKKGSFLHDKYGGKKGYRKRREELLSMHRRPSASSSVNQPAQLQLAPESTNISRIELNKIDQRLFPAIDLRIYNCSYTQEYKAGPFYEDCVYDDDEMKLSSLVDHGTSFNPLVGGEDEAEVAKYLLFFVLNCC
jgi:hypothetical protein